MAFLDLLCVGAQKAGTTWLHSMLSQHPDVFRAPLKEVHYFNSLHVPERRQRAERVKKQLFRRIKSHKKNRENPSPEKLAWLESLADKERILTTEWYEQLFSGPGSDSKIKFEKTPAYSAMPLEGIQHVKSLLGDIPIIFIIRDPLNRMLSQIRATAMRKFSDEPISDSDWDALYRRIPERGDYETYIPRWLSVFPDNNMHFIPFQRIPREPESVMRFVEGLVGLPPYVYRNPRRNGPPSNRINVPPSVVDRLTEHVAPQYAFLEQQFGKDFVEQI